MEETEESEDQISVGTDLVAGYEAFLESINFKTVWETLLERSRND